MKIAKHHFTPLEVHLFDNSFRVLRKFSMLQAFFGHLEQNIFARFFIDLSWSENSTAWISWTIQFSNYQWDESMNNGHSTVKNSTIRWKHQVLMEFQSKVNRREEREILWLFMLYLPPWRSQKKEAKSSLSGHRDSLT